MAGDKFTFAGGIHAPETLADCYFFRVTQLFSSRAITNTGVSASQPRALSAPKGQFLKIASGLGLHVHYDNEERMTHSKRIHLQS